MHSDGGPFGVWMSVQKKLSLYSETVTEKIKPTKQSHIKVNTSFPAGLRRDAYDQCN